MNINIPDNLSYNQLIALLKSERDFDTISFFPLGAFWWVVLSFIALYVLYFYISSNNKFIQKYLAKLEFKKIRFMIQSNKNNLDVLLKLSDMIRRVSVVVFGNCETASLHSAKWVDFIIAHDNKKRIDNKNVCLIANAPYLSGLDVDNVNIVELYNQSYLWSMDNL